MATQKAVKTATPNAAQALRGALKILTGLQRSDARKDKVIARLQAKLDKQAGKPAVKVARTPRAAKATDEDEEAPARKTKVVAKSTKAKAGKPVKAAVKTTKAKAEKPAAKSTKTAKAGKVVKGAKPAAKSAKTKAPKGDAFLI